MHQRLAGHLSHGLAGFIAFLISYAGSAAIVFQAAQAAGASPEMLASWLWALGIGIGAAGIGLSLSTRMPVLTGWSTPGAALLATSLVGLTLNETIGGFVVASLLMTLVGISGRISSIMRIVPKGIASAMLAGVLLRFGTAAFAALTDDLVLVGSMVLAFFLGRRFLPRQFIPGTLACGLAVAAVRGDFTLVGVNVTLAKPIFVAPSFSLAAMLGVGVPLFFVTLASQNLPGLVVLRAHGYEAPGGRIVGWTGLAGLVLAPFGAFSINLAAITAALCMGPEVDPDPAKRYRSTLWAGVFYLVTGVFAGTMASLLIAIPHLLIVAFTGLALLGTIGASLGAALENASEREAAVVTLLVTASGLSLWGVGSAFWGILSGLAVAQVRGR